MAGRESANVQSRKGTARRRVLFGVGASAGVFLAAAAMATGSAVTAAPAKADVDALIDPIINSISASLVTLDPAGAADITSWTDSLLASLNSIDVAAPAAAEPAGALPAADPTTGTYEIPITMQEDTEPTVQAAIGGGPDQTLLVDTGSSGLVIPWEDLGSNDFSALENLFALGYPSSPYIGESGYSGGVDYVYLTYNDATVDYGDGALTTTNTPIDVEIFSFPTSAGSPASFEDFLADNDSTGILGVGDSASDGGPTTSPFDAVGFNGVTVDIPNVPTTLDEPDGALIVSASNPGTAIDTISGAPISSTALTETVKDGSTVVGTGPVYDDIDSGGVYGTIPASIDSSTVAPGDTITVSDGSTVLYSYTVGTDTPDGTDEAPEVGSGIGSSSSPIDSGIEAFLGNTVYIDYANDTLSFDSPLP